MNPELPMEFLSQPVAHRALHDVKDGRPENSRAAIRAAIKAGYAIEIDLQCSSDGCPMVFHDDTLDRLAEASGPVTARSRAELEQIPLKGGEFIFRLPNRRSCESLGCHSSHFYSLQMQPASP